MTELPSGCFFASEAETPIARPPAKAATEPPRTSSDTASPSFPVSANVRFVAAPPIEAVPCPIPTAAATPGTL